MLIFLLICQAALGVYYMIHIIISIKVIMLKITVCKYNMIYNKMLQLFEYIHMHLYIHFM